MRIMQQNQLGFEFNDFTIYDGFNGSGFCYFNEEGNSFYTCNVKDAGEWWNEESMDLTLNCPFCESTVGGFYDKDRPYVKHWMGKHLAIFHPIEVEQTILKQEQEEEYGSTKMAESPDLYDEEYYGFYC